METEGELLKREVPCSKEIYVKRRKKNTSLNSWFFLLFFFNEMNGKVDFVKNSTILFKQRNPRRFLNRETRGEDVIHPGPTTRSDEVPKNYFPKFPENCDTDLHKNVSRKKIKKTVRV